jgi:hypothetical protein
MRELELCRPDELDRRRAWLTLPQPDLSVSGYRRLYVQHCFRRMRVISIS